MTISLTPTAATQIKKQLTQRGQGLGLKIGIKKSGCSGLAYTLAFVDALEMGDQIFNAREVQLIINTADLPVLNGLELDYQREGLNAAFKFNNPNVVGTCGCGSSFSVS